MATLPRILLVDDDYTTNFLNTNLLRHLDPGVQVRTALNGQEALDLLCTPCPPTSSDPVLLFLDVNMPLMDGFAFLEAYQRLPRVQQQGVVVVMLTTSVNPRDLARLQALPIAGILDKPLTKEKVAQVLADHFAPLPAVL